MVMVRPRRSKLICIQYPSVPSHSEALKVSRYTADVYMQRIIYQAYGDSIIQDKTTQGKNKDKVQPGLRPGLRQGQNRDITGNNTRSKQDSTRQDERKSREQCKASEGEPSQAKT